MTDETAACLLVLIWYLATLTLAVVFYAVVLTARRLGLRARGPRILPWGTVGAAPRSVPAKGTS